MPKEVGLKPATERHSFSCEALSFFFFTLCALQGSIHFSYRMAINFKLLHYGSIKMFSQYLKDAVKVEGELH